MRPVGCLLEFGRGLGMINLRAALYWTPNPDDPLLRAGNSWLGRDAELGTAILQPPVAGLQEATAAPRLYGFHATLRPPMRLATGWEEFIGAADVIAQATAPFALPRLEVADLDGFLALRETQPCPALHAFADACVRGTDAHRLRPDAAELARRRKSSLTPRQDEMLLRWGYPHVLQEWRFHMTLSRRLTAPDMALMRPAAEAHFAAALAHRRLLDTVAVFTQSGDRAFLLAERIALRGR